MSAGRAEARLAGARLASARLAGASLAGALIAAALLAGGCSTRERLNPLDPKNDRTQGALTGFDATAADGIVEFRWPALSLEGLLGYRVQRWRPGEAPQALGSSDYPPPSIAGEDPDVRNDSTYVYRLVAHLARGDSVLSPPDTVTPGVRRILALEAGTPAFARLSPDARDVLFARSALEAYEDMELDLKREAVWLAIEGLDLVILKTLDGATLAPGLTVPGPVDVAVSNNRGIGWVASPAGQRVVAFGPDPTNPDLVNPNPQVTINAIGHPRVVEAGTLDPGVWIGNDEGSVYRVRPQDGARTDEWLLGAGGIRAIALDQAAGAAWIATRSGPASDLYYLAPGDSARTLVRRNLSNVVDLAVDPQTGDLWVSERGAPNVGAGRVSRLSRSGATLASASSLEPYGIDVDPLDGSCWVSDLRSARLLRLTRDCVVTRASSLLDAPYAVRIHVP